MSDLKTIDKISAEEVNQKGVVSLAVRPNQPSQYGEGNLSAKELQKRFDQLARLAISRCNMLTQLLSGEYIPNIQNNEKESILEYILVVKAEDSGLSADMSLADVFAEILTTDGQLKAIDPTADDGAFAELNTVIAKLYEKLSDNSESVTSIENTIDYKLPVQMAVEELDGLHRFVFINKKGRDIDGSEFYIDLFSHHNEDDNAHDNKFSSIETTVEANKKELQQQIDNCKERVDDVEVDVGVISRDLGEFKSTVNDILNSDDTDLDQLKEIVDYIKSNKSLIDAITTSKVSKTSQTVNRVAYVNDKGADTTVPIINDVKADKVNFNAYSIACRNKSGCITVANPIESYDAVNKQTMEAKAESLLSTADERYAKKIDVGVSGGSFTLKRSQTLNENALIYGCRLSIITLIDSETNEEIEEFVFSADLEFIHPITHGFLSDARHSCAFLYIRNAYDDRRLFYITESNLNDYGNGDYSFSGYCLADHKTYRLKADSVLDWLQPVSTDNGVTAAFDELHEYAQGIISGVSE